MEFLRDSIWQFIGSTIGVLGVITTIWIYLLQKNRKGFSYLILTSHELLTASEEIRGRIKVSFDKKPVQSVHLLVVKFTNNGNVPILLADFYQPIKIHFGEKTKILSADVIEHFPETFDPVINIEGNCLSIAPTLINSRDSFSIKFLLAQYIRGEMKISGRIAGIKAVTEDTSIKTWRRIKRVNFLVVGATFLMIAIISIGPADSPTISWTFILFAIGGILDAIANIASSRPYKSKKK